MIYKLLREMPQRSVLAPMLFSLYIADLPTATSRNFGKADDWAIARQRKDFAVTQNTLLNAPQMEAICFHLNNEMANQEIQVNFEEPLLTHNKTLRYFGVTVDRTISFKKHLTDVAANFSTRNNILQMLYGTS